MSAHDRPTFLYKLETACRDLLAPNSNADVSSVLRDHFDFSYGSMNKRTLSYSDLL